MSTSSQRRPQQLAGLAAALAFVVAAGAASPSVADSPKSGGSIKIAVVGDPGTISPLKDGGIAANYVSELIRDRLVCSGQDGDYVPCLATSWDTPNPTTFIFHLRQGVKFSNGAPFTAADAKYTYDQIAFGKESDFVGAEGPIKETKVIDE